MFDFRMSQKIDFIHPPDLSTGSSHNPVAVSLPQGPPALVSLPQDPPAVLSWKEKDFPPILLRGVMFGQAPVEIECKVGNIYQIMISVRSVSLAACYTRMSSLFIILTVPSFAYTWYYSQISYPVGDIIPLRLTLTSESRVALDLLAVSHVIDVQLDKVMAFGKQATTVRPLSLWNRTAFHRSDLVAKAHWRHDGHPRELPPDDENQRTRWSVKLNGNLERETNIELTPSFEDSDSGMAHMVRTIDVIFGQGLNVNQWPLVVLCEPLPIPVDRFPACMRSKESAGYGQNPAHCAKPPSKLMFHPFLCYFSHDFTLRSPSCISGSIIDIITQ